MSGNSNNNKYDPWDDIFAKAEGKEVVQPVVITTNRSEGKNDDRLKSKKDRGAKNIPTIKVSHTSNGNNNNSITKKRKLKQQPTDDIDDNNVYLRKRCDNVVDNNFIISQYQFTTSLMVSVDEDDATNGLVCQSFVGMNGTPPVDAATTTTNCTTIIKETKAKNHSYNYKCQNCDLLRIEHQRRPIVEKRESIQSQSKSYHSDCSFVLSSIVCCIYNIRSVGKTWAKQQNQERKQPCIKIMKKQMHILQQNLDMLSSSTHHHHPIIDSDTNELIQKCCYDIVTKTNIIISNIFQARKEQHQQREHHKSKSRRMNNKTSSFDLFEHAIRLIISCDAAYYRLYYFQITRRSQSGLDDDSNNDSNKDVFISHPVTYFGEFVQHLISEDNETMKHFNGKTDNENALAVLHKYRMLETIELFQQTGWYNLPNTMLQTKDQIIKMERDIENSKHLKNQRNKNNKNDHDSSMIEYETPASPLLMEWRDSCRDYLCHLYSYATISNETIKRIVQNVYDYNKTSNNTNNDDNNDAVIQEKMDHIIEMGAGTGYIASLLSSIGNINVTPYDITPTIKDDNNNTNNEYHGLTPSFMTVRRKAVTSEAAATTTVSLSRIYDDYGGWTNHNNCIQNQKLIKERKDKKKYKSQSALLLCYPPPQNPMALHALRDYVSMSGGKLFIHIGEFKGLTGSKEFESYLLNEFVLMDRISCLHWGTDASEVTIWVRKTKKINEKNVSTAILKKKYSVLIPCSCCKQKESIKRLRLFRAICYCSEICFKNHAKERNSVLFLNQNPMMMISNYQNIQLDFHKNSHFQQLL